MTEQLQQTHVSPDMSAKSQDTLGMGGTQGQPVKDYSFFTVGHP